MFDIIRKDKNSVNLYLLENALNRTDKEKRNFCLDFRFFFLQTVVKIVSGP
jgi:hypothetical protein